MVSSTIVFVQTSCIIPQAILLFRGRDKVLPERQFSLGRYGVAINSVAVAWVVFLDIIYCFPIVMPVTPPGMNYVSVVTTGLIAFVLGLWFISKKGKFVGPHVDIIELESRRRAAIHSVMVIDNAASQLEDEKLGLSKRDSSN
jgi:choline transport protein